MKEYMCERNLVEGLIKAIDLEYDELSFPRYLQHLFIFFFKFYIWSCHVAFGILVP